jgi:hypothetical protein
MTFCYGSYWGIHRCPQLSLVDTDMLLHMTSLAPPTFGTKTGRRALLFWVRVYIMTATWPMPALPRKHRRVGHHVDPRDSRRTERGGAASAAQSPQPARPPPPPAPQAPAAAAGATPTVRCTVCERRHGHCCADLGRRRELLRATVCEAADGEETEGLRSGLRDVRSELVPRESCLKIKSPFSELRVELRLERGAGRQRERDEA